MAYAGSSAGEFGSLRAEGREPGARRKKLAGYLKAANELRQSYFNTEHHDGMDHGPVDGPGAFPHAAVTRSGNEEMILFPSYAKPHSKDPSDRRSNSTVNLTEEEYWRREWDRHEDSNAVVDVDVRGWIYTPQRGPITRKQRLMIGLARQLSGLPASSTNRPGDSGSSSPTRAQEEDLITLEAEKIVRNGQREEQYADRGAFSEPPGSSQLKNGSRDNAHSNRQRASYAGDISLREPEMLSSQHKRMSWTVPTQMTPAELDSANKHLFARLRPFMASPIIDTPISAFFYNDEASRQQTVYTDASGHFSFRAALNFVPTHVRVLVGEKLSATEEVMVTSPKGVSLISDIDDTVKHSAVTAGAREIFRTAFIRELGDLTIEGVREWYTKMHDMGVKLHYVSNSPWQMYPILTTYFKLAQLPKGSFHLKQYTGMLQGIFEPVAERKKASLEKLMRDFPDRKFILVGDSGEADLEVYTDVALDYPGKILGIFIRDVTSTTKTGYFDPNNSPSGGSTPRPRSTVQDQSGDSLSMSKKIARPDDIRNDDADLEAAVAASLQSMQQEALNARRSINPDAHVVGGFRPTVAENAKPRLPPRLPTRSANSKRVTPPVAASSAHSEDLIDFAELPPQKPWLSTPPGKAKQSEVAGENDSSGNYLERASSLPAPPPKPANLRAATSSAERRDPNEDSGRPTPPLPRKPSSAVKSNVSVPSGVSQTDASVPFKPVGRAPEVAAPAKVPPPLPGRRRAARDSSARTAPHQGLYRQSDPNLGVSRAYAAGASQAYSQPSSPLARPVRSATSFDDFNLPVSAMARPVPHPPPRREYASASSSRQWSDARPGSFDDRDAGGSSSPSETLSKKEHLWRQRWARARNLLEREGVTLRTWRIGSDVADVCVKLVELALRDMGRETQRPMQTGRR